MTSFKNYLVALILLLLFCCSYRIEYSVYTEFLKTVPAPELSRPQLLNFSDSSLSDSLKVYGNMLALYKNTKSLRIYSVHEPYKNRKCNKCHKTSDRSIELIVSKNLCVECHKEYVELKGYVHGPVAANDCKVCHDPHLSPFTSLLLRGNQFLCTYCHAISNLIPIKEHEGKNGEICTSCHSPHNSETSRFFIKTEKKELPKKNNRMD